MCAYLVAILLAGDAVGAANAPLPRVDDQFFPAGPRWAIDLLATPAASPATDGSAVFVPLRDGTLAAVTMAEGRLLWRIQAPTAFTPALDGGLVIIVGQDAVESFDAATGSVVWRTPLAAEPATAPVARGGWVFALVASGDLTALDVESGRAIWTRSLHATGGIPPVIDGDRVVVGLDDGRVTALAVLTGEPVWEQTIGGAVSGLAAVHDRVLVGARDNFFYVLERGNGRLDWRWRTGGDVIGQAAADDRQLYFVSLDNLLRVLRRRSGGQQWKRDLPWRPTSGPLLVASTILVGGLAPEIRGFAVRDGRPAGRLQLDAELPVPPVLVLRDLPELDGVLAITSVGTLRLFVSRIDPPLVPPATLPGQTVVLTPPAVVPPPAPPPTPR